MRVALLVPIGFALGAAACRIALRFAPADFNVDLTQPLVVVTYWQSFGAEMWLCLFGAVAIGAVGYFLFLRMLASSSSAALRDAWYITLVSVIACACALAFPVVFSSDVYAYAGYGAMSLHGIDPYAHARVTLRDPLLDAMLWQWGNPPPMCVYGPAFVWISKIAVAVLQQAGPAAPLWALRILSCIALVVCAPLAYTAFAPFGCARSSLAAAGIALNPIAIWSCAEGHNDAIVVAIVLGGFALVARSRTFAGAATVALASLIKAPALAAATAFALFAWHDARVRWTVFGGTAAGVVFAAAIAAPLEYGVGVHLAPGGHYAPQFSVQSALALILPLEAAATVTFALCGVAAVLGGIQLYRGNADGAIAIAFAAWLALPNPYPWYAIWFLPVAFLAASDAPEEMWAIVAASLLVVLRYYAEATTDLGTPLSVVIVAAQFGVPIALLMAARTYRAHRVRREIRTTGPDFATTRNS